MGWKPGQGIGPKLTYRQLKLQERQIRSLSGFAGSIVNDEEEDEEASKHLYPPRDTPLAVYVRKDNSFGIGYTPGARLEASTGNNDATGPGGSGHRISGPSFSYFAPPSATIYPHQ
jgi:G patch domain-containing protein 1